MLAAPRVKCENIAITNTDLIASNELDESLAYFQSDVGTQSSDDPQPDHIQHVTPGSSEINQRDMLATYLLQIEFHLKSCQNLIKDSTRNDIPHKEFVEKTQSFVIELKTILGSLDTTFHEQIEEINVQFSNVEFEGVWCANSNCLPFVTTTAPNILQCQIHCLRQPQCKATTFEKTTCKCQLFNNTADQNSNLQANIQATTMIVISGTRMPPVQQQSHQAQHQLVQQQPHQAQHQLVQQQPHQAQHQLVQQQQPRYQRLHRVVVRNKRNNDRFLCAE
ncbi:unnamed protein product [Adineta ricciae]|uniref:Apple domain-containing protein n=1 Tax=Adineta ricciae TaxID=249248 RepID=A0A816E4C6_ADIRI|nr:unnamed protein product [Adineta ricciae]